MCVSWRRTNGPLSRTLCDNFATTVTAALSGRSLAPMNLPFTCRGDNATHVTVCGEFFNEADARSVGAYLSTITPIGTSGFTALAVTIDLNNIVIRNETLGAWTCRKSSLSVAISDRRGGTCVSASYAPDCPPLPRDEFPYIPKCEAGVKTKTPYTLSYSRKFVRPGINAYCFSVSFNPSQCGISPCCNMDLNKVEFLTDHDWCQQAVDGWTISTQPSLYRAPSFSREKDRFMNRDGTVTAAVFRANYLRLNATNANGAELCIMLKTNNRCNTMEKFCYAGVCQYAVFDSKFRCCTKDFAPGNEFNKYSA